MGTAIMWLIIGVINIITSVLNKQTHESKGKLHIGTACYAVLIL